MARYQVNVSIPESEGFLFVDADSPEEAMAQVGDAYEHVFITWVNGRIEPNDAWESE